MSKLMISESGEGGTFHINPTVINFMCGSTWALRIDQNGITSNPDVPTDDGAKAIFEALKSYLETLKR